MVDAEAKPSAIAVLHAGRTEVRLSAVSPRGRILSWRQAPNAIKTGEPYPHCDVGHIERWLMAALRDLGERFAIEAVVPIAYGSTAALIDDEGELALPVMDYESPRPAEVAPAYAEVAPWFEECFCPIDAGGLTLGRQLFWQSRTFPEQFARARWILPFPQFWAWRLSGVMASEVTSLGARTQLWSPRAQDFSSLARQQGWVERFPPLRKAWSVLGPLRADVAVRARLRVDTPVLCGIHERAAGLARYLAGGVGDFALISGGTWLETCSPGLPLERLDPLRDVAADVDLDGRPVACARLMGGRACDEIAADPDLSDVHELLERGEALSPCARAAQASLHVALMASAGLDLLQADAPVIIDGNLAEPALMPALLAALRPDQKVLLSGEREVTATGAALLWGWPERREPLPLPLKEIEAPGPPGLEGYAARWRAEALP
jgi:hypothetical protein